MTKAKIRAPGGRGTDLLLLCPVYYGDSTGSSVYYQLLVKTLYRKGFSTTVISESVDRSSAVPDYIGLLPARGSRNRALLHDLFSYGLQNLRYLKLESILRRTKPRALLVHSSFYNRPGIFRQVGRRFLAASRRLGCRTVADVRDRLMPVRKIAALKEYDRAVACSANVNAHLQRAGLPPHKITEIPIPQEPLKVDRAGTESFLEAVELKRDSYLLYVGHISSEKGVDLLLDAFQQHVLPNRPELLLAIVGLVKTSDKKLLQRLDHPSVRMLGNLRRNEVLMLTAGASVCVNPSPNESISRTCLEAIALERPVVLPASVPEYERYCPDAVLRERTPAALAALITGFIERPVAARYPLERHEPERVFERYIDLLFES